MANLIEIIIRSSSSQATGEIGKANKALAGLGKTALGVAGGLGLAVGARELIALNAEAMELGRTQKDARNALTSTVGSAAAYSRAIEQARAATRNMVDETDLAVGINSVLNMHLASNAQEAAELAMAGATLSKVYAASGATMEKYFRLLSGGAGALYDNFALTTELVSKRRDEIVAATGVSEAEAKLQAIRQLTIEEARRYNDALSEETVAASQSQAASQDLKAAWGELSNQLIYGSGIAGKAAEAMHGLTATLKGETAEAARSQAQSILLAAESYLAYQQNMEAAYLTGQTLTEQQFNSVKAALAASDATADLGSEAIRLAAAANREVGAIQKANAETAEVSGWAAVAARAQADLGDEYLTSAGKLEQYVNALARAQMYGSYAPAMETATDWQSFQDQLNAERIGRENDAQKELQRIQLDSARETADRLKSTIEGVLGQTTLSEVWQAPADTGRIDENARRLATVATSGFGSEWLAQLNQQFQGMSFWQPITDAMATGDTGALQQAATQLLTGPSLSQLWDKELIKQRIREQLQAENMRAELVDTIQQELAGEGLAVGTAEVGMAMGGGAGVAQQLTGGLSAALPGAMAETGMGATIMGAIQDQVKANEKGAGLIASAIAESIGDKFPAALGVTADQFMEALVAHVAARLGLSMELRP